MLQFHTFSRTNHGRTLLEMLGVLAIVGILSITALVGFTYAMNKHRANETIYDVMLRGTNVPMVDEYYFDKDAGYEFRFPGLVNNGRQGTYYPMVTLKDGGASYYVEATDVTYRVCELILKMNPTDIDQIVVGDTVYTGDSDICGTNNGLAMKFCFGSDGDICDGTNQGGSSGSSGTGSGSGSGSGDNPDACQPACNACEKCVEGTCVLKTCSILSCPDGQVSMGVDDCGCIIGCKDNCPEFNGCDGCREEIIDENGCRTCSEDQTISKKTGTCCASESGTCCPLTDADCVCTPAETCTCEERGGTTVTIASGSCCNEVVDCCQIDEGDCPDSCEPTETNCPVGCGSASLLNPGKTCSDGSEGYWSVEIQGKPSGEADGCCLSCSGEPIPHAFWNGSAGECCFGKVNQKEDGSFICCPADKPYWAPTYFKYTGVGQITKSNWACSACPESEMYFTANDSDNAKYGVCACPDGQHAITIGEYKNICCSESVEGFYLWGDYYPQCCYDSSPNSVFDQNGQPQCCGADQRYWAPRYFKYTGVNEITKSDWGCSACPESEMYFTANDSDNAKYGVCACPDGQHAVSVGNNKNICCSEKVEGFYLWGDYYPQCCYDSSPNVVYDSEGVAHCCGADQRYWVPRYFKYTGVNEITKSDWGCSACPESEMYFTADDTNNAKRGECACPSGQRAVSTEYASRICCSEKVEGFYLWGDYYPQCCYESTPKLFNGPTGVRCCRTDAVGVDKNGNCCNPPDKLIGSTCCGSDATGLDEDGNCEY